MEDSADKLKRILKPYEPIEKALKDSFTDVRGAISNCLKQFGKNDLFTCIQHEKLVPEKHLDVEKDNVTQKRNSDNKVKRPQQMVDEKDQQTPLQLFYKHEGKTIEEIEKGIKTILVNKFGAIDFTNCQKASDIDGKTLLIIPYIVTSRVAADAENAIEDIPNPENTALLLIHNKEAHALPTQKSSLTLTDQKFKNLRRIIDLAFTTGNGFYHCDMNSRGIDSLCSCCRPTPRNEVRL
ncbi:uncharacterized protein LOC123566456 [Mercenaria mercenaria]|uniref:uncharacterized protein LOC123566456 n=1 Tax=Mercenaria mercenaria TaxID=6596 RepID=UPI00234F7A7A|nr:uncharacterized protein LOC123566456 [Mercenaria mercenaria]